MDNSNEKNSFSGSLLAIFGVLSLSMLIILLFIGININMDFRMARKNSEVINLRLAQVHNSSYPSSTGAYTFAKLVEEKTDGRIKIEIFYNGQLGSDEDSIAEQIQFGGIDFACVNSSAMCSFSPVLEVLQLPYLIESRNHLHNVLDSELGYKMLHAADEKKILGLAFYDEGPRLYCNSLHPVSHTGNLVGLRLGVSKNRLPSDMVEMLGAQAVSLAYGDVYQSLQTGRINGLEDSLVNYVQSNYFVEAKYVTLSEHSMPPSILIASKDVMDTLSAEDQQIIYDAAQQSISQQRQDYATAENRALNFLENSSCELVHDIWTNAMFTNRTRDIYDNYKHYNDIIETVKKLKTTAADLI